MLNKNLLMAAIVGAAAVTLLGALAVSGGLAQASPDGDDDRDDLTKYGDGPLQSDNHTHACDYHHKHGYNHTYGHCGDWKWHAGHAGYFLKDDYGAGKAHWPGTLAVTGYASTQVEPELLMVTLGVEAIEPTAREALASNSRVLTAVIDALNATGVSEDEISTSYLNIYQEYESIWDEFGQNQRVPVGYRATNVITVTTANLDKAAEILDGAAGAGATRVESVRFTISPETGQAVREGLIADAVSNARHKADLALAPLDYRIVGIDSIAVDSTEPLSRVFAETLAFAADFARATADASPPIFSSDQTISTAVTIVFLIGPE